MAEISTLNMMINDMVSGRDKQDFDQVELLRDQKTQELPWSGSAIVTTCKHCISNCNLIPGDSTHKVYLEGELPCFLCKKPSNLPIPIFPKQVYETLWRENSENLEITLESVLSDLEKLLASENFEESSVFFAGEKLSEASITSMSAELEASDQLVSKAMVNNTLFKDMKDNASKLTFTDPAPVEWLILNSFIEVLLYSSLYGLANSAANFSMSYHNINLALKLMLTREHSEKLGSETKTRILYSLSVIGQSLSTIRDLNSEEFLNCDLERIFCRALVHSVIDFY